MLIRFLVICSKNALLPKTYMALVHGHPPASGTIDLSIGRHPPHRKKMTTFIPDDKALSTTKLHMRTRNQARSQCNHSLYGQKIFC